jgi:hypothetical protein
VFTIRPLRSFCRTTGFLASKNPYSHTTSIPRDSPIDKRNTDGYHFAGRSPIRPTDLVAIPKFCRQHDCNGPSHLTSFPTSGAIYIPRP